MNKKKLKAPIKNIFLLASVVIGSLCFYWYAVSDKSASDKNVGAMAEIPSVAPEIPHNKNPIRDALAKLKRQRQGAKKGGEQVDVEALPHAAIATKVDGLVNFDAEIMDFCHEVEKSIGTVFYFENKRSLIDRLKESSQLDKIEKLVSQYDDKNVPEEEGPALIHYGLLAVGEASAEEGLERATRLYRSITDNLARLDKDPSNLALKGARLSDVYDLVRNVAANQSFEKSLRSWPEIEDFLDDFHVRESYLSHGMKEQLKNALASVIHLDSVDELHLLHEKLDHWWEN